MKRRVWAMPTRRVPGLVEVTPSMLTLLRPRLRNWELRVAVPTELMRALSSGVRRDASARSAGLDELDPLKELEALGAFEWVELVETKRACRAPGPHASAGCVSSTRGCAPKSPSASVPSVTVVTRRPVECPFPSTSTSRSEEHTSELQSRPHLVCRL